MARRKPSIVDQLNRLYGGGWRAVREEGDWSWHWTNGTHTVQPYSETVLGWDGYRDDVFNTTYLTETGVKVGLNGLIWGGMKL